MKLHKDQKGFGAIEILLTIIALGLIGGVGYYVYHSQKEDKQPVTSTANQTTPPASTSAAPKIKLLPDLVDYDDGMIVEKPSDVSKLKNASDSFKQFIADVVKDNETPITVTKIYKDEFASGGGGGAMAIWKNKSGSWTQIVGGNDLPECSLLEKEKVPAVISIAATISGECYDQDGSTVKIKS